MPVLKVHASACDIEQMVQSEDLRAEFVERLKKALTHAAIPEWGAGARLAEITGKTAKAAGKWLNAESMPGRANMVAIASWLNVRLEWLAHGEGEMLQGKAPDPAPGAPSEKDYALIPQYTAKGSAGNGHLNEHVEVKGGLAFKRDWLARLGVKEQRCSVIYAQGSSMEPSIGDGEVVLLDHDATEPRDGKVYVLQRADGEIIIKRLIKQMSGWVIRSDNEDKRRYPDEPISADNLQHVEVVGRVVWRGGGM